MGVVLLVPNSLQASAGMSVSASNYSIEVGDTVTLSVMVSTGGDSANAFEGTFNYSSSLFDAVRGSSSGSVCSIFVTQPNPSGGSADFACGNPAGFTGSGKVIDVVLQAKAPGTASVSLAGCSVLANDGNGTDITGGCSGTSVSIANKATPTPTPISTPPPATTVTSPTANPAAAKRTPPPVPATPTPGQVAKVAETPKATEAPAATPTPPPAQTLPPATPTPSARPQTSSTDDGSTDSGEKRTVAGAFQDLLSNAKSFRINKNSDTSGLFAILLTFFPLLGVVGAIVFFTYRLYLLEHHRRRRMSLLFEAQLAELAALEGKMDLLAEKGAKGREQYREEFDRAKERILQQVNPNYNKKVAPLPEEAPPKA